MGYSFESLSHVSEVPLKPESFIVAVAIAVAGVMNFDSDGGPSTLSSFRVLPSEDLSWTQILSNLRVRSESKRLSAYLFLSFLSGLMSWDIR